MLWSQDAEYSFSSSGQDHIFETLLQFSWDHLGSGKGKVSESDIYLSI